MGVWTEEVVPRATRVALATGPIRRLRHEALHGLVGPDVVEIGFGSGPNVALYPPGVERVLAVEPSAVARRRARARAREGGLRIEFIAPDAEELPLPGASVDAAISTFTLCTVDDAARALGELLRVLRPGGRLHFMEHGRSPDERVAAWQRRLTPLQRRVAAGCRLDRPMERLVTEAGFVLDAVRTTDLRAPRLLRPWLHVTVGTARKPGGAEPSSGG